MLKAKDIAKLTKEEAQKKLGEMERSLLELEQFSQKRKSVKKSIARLHTYIHSLAGKPVKAPVSGKKSESKTVANAPNIARAKASAQPNVSKPPAKK